ncbi:hypothetical protein F8388_005383 (mitochondrion) [Cannabis sativa]|uniref:Uncharacterized protein n=1 Tax=Cannabis sativa TaxID=3483 RepID=A0A7J6DQH3_CANSA|nr:hypothetical protein F8388_005383 [Cannabis sativa]
MAEGGRVEPREALLRGRSLTPLHSLQGPKPFFNIEGDGESGQNRLAFLIEQIREKNPIENVPNPPTPSFVEPCIHPLGFGVDPFTLFYYIRLAKRMFFDTPRTWILYEPMDRDKSLLLAMTSSFITSSFPYPSPLFSVTHQMALNLYL